MKNILCGADRIAEYALLFKNKRIGLITNPTGANASFVQTADIFAKKYKLQALFAPEHGVRGDAQDGQSITSYIDEATGAVVHSIYGEMRAPKPEMLKNIDVMVYDIQDVGSRYYTFIYTMANCLAACGEAGIPFVVLDRPNPLGGAIVAGTAMQPQNRSFIGMYDIPQQYGLTCGELANFFNATEHLGAEVTVVPLQSWERKYLQPDYFMPQISPSPNLPCFESVLLYNGTCLFEGLNVSEGRGTTKPFQYVGAPFINADKYAQKLNSLSLSGVYFRPVYFTPMFSKYKGQLCGGVQAHIINAREVKPLYMGAAMVLCLKSMYPNELVFVPPNHEKGDFTLDLLWGSSYLRQDSATIASAFEQIEQNTALKAPLLRKYHIY